LIINLLYKFAEEKRFNPINISYNKKFNILVTWNNITPVYAYMIVFSDGSIWPRTHI